MVKKEILVLAGASILALGAGGNAGAVTLVRRFQIVDML